MDERRQRRPGGGSASPLRNAHNIHLIGIGGFGISAIARVLLGQGYKVSGSDMNRNDLSMALAHDGATIYEGHAAEYVNGADMVIRSSAVKDDHIEVVAARERGIPVYKRNDIIADLMDGKTVIAVAGTHGKTTTTAMIVHILKECGKDPSYIVGGIMANTGTNAGVGKGDLFVVEADEYDNMFLGLRPDVAVVTSIEFDHPDFFESEMDLYLSFLKFVNLLSDDGVLVLNTGDALGQILYDTKIASDWNRMIFTYGDAEKAMMQAKNIRVIESLTIFDIQHPGGEIHSAILQVFGRHNVLNALGAIIAVKTGRVWYTDAVEALATFKSTGRRFEVRGEVGGVVVVDDYAHHPTAINVTLEAATMRYPHHRLYAIWQPHTFSRTEALLDQFATAFSYADVVLVTDIYKSREQPTAQSITGAQVVDAIQHSEVHYTGSLTDTTDFLLETVRAPAVIVVMSAGDAPQISAVFLEKYGSG